MLLPAAITVGWGVGIEELKTASGFTNNRIFGFQVLGYIIVLLAFSLQSILKTLCGRLVGFWRVCVVDVYLFFSFCGTINVWRGIWLLLNIYFLPGKLSVQEYFQPQKILRKLTPRKNFFYRENLQ
jgi:hypothetical protein